MGDKSFLKTVEEKNNMKNKDELIKINNNGSASNIVILDFEESLLNQYIKLERKTQAVVDKALSKEINQASIDQIIHHLSTLKICLESLEKERQLRADYKKEKTYIDRQIDLRKFRLINSMEELLEILKENKCDSKSVSIFWIPKIP